MSRQVANPSGSAAPEGEQIGQLWGADPVVLHDRLWATRGIQVVRGDEAGVDRSGPGLYLLLRPNEMVELPVGAILRQLHWLRVKALRIRVVDRSRASYTETVDAEADGRFVAIKRHYNPAAHASGRCWITPDANLARRWARVSSSGGDWADMRRDLPRDSLGAMRCEGSIFASDEPGESERWFRAVGTSWTEVSDAFEGVYQFQPGVWVHESVEVPRSVRFCGTAWVGAGVELPENSIVLGPVLLPDAADSDTTLSPLSWEDAYSPHGRLLPMMRAPGLRRITKRAFDICFSAAVLLAFLPVFPILMLLIYLEDGRPFFFAHTRQTSGGRDFPCYKFRTMVNNADEMKAQLEAENVCDGPQFFIENDPRVLKCGAWMRRFQFDEIPQFWNVLLGHMSVVGPRPSPDKENQYCPAWREARLSVRPGLTGLWQVRRTREPQTDFQEWIKYDLEYVRRQSWPMDLWIITETVKKVIGG